MKKLMLGLIISFTMAALAGALVPQFINYQGILRDSAGNLQDGTFSMDFKIWDAVSGGNLKDGFSKADVLVSNGLYNVEMGPLNTTVFDGSNLWLEITVSGDTLSPRLKINSVAYAITADVAETAKSANYAAVSGTATNAADATTVNGIYADVNPTGGKLYPLDPDGKLSGVPISAEANTSGGFAVYVNNTNNGRIGIKTSGAGTSGDPAIGAVGTGSITGGNTSATIYNNAVTNNSLIFITPRLDGSVGANNAWLKVKTKSAGQFTVSTYNESNFNSNTLYFDYLIVN